MGPDRPRRCRRQEPRDLLASIGTPLLERGLIDEVDLHVLPRLLGAGTRLYEVAGGSMRKLKNLGRRRPECSDQPPFLATYEN